MITDYLLEEKFLNNLFNDESKPKRQLLTGINEHLTPAVIASVFQHAKKTLLLISKDKATTEKLYLLLQGYVNVDDLCLFTQESSLATETSVSSVDLTLERVKTLNEIKNNKIILTDYAGITRILPDPKAFYDSKLNLVKGLEYDFAAFPGLLRALGYEQVEFIEKIGQFAIRGSIIDFYPLDNENPIRLDFFDNELDLIKEFNLQSQLTINELKEFSIQAVHDILITDEEKAVGIEKLNQAFIDYRKELKGAEKRKITAYFERFFEQLKNNELPRDLILYLDYFYTKKASLFDYLADDAIVAFNDLDKISEAYEKQKNKNEEWLIEKVDQFKALDSKVPYYDLNELILASKHNYLFLDNLKASNLNQFKLTASEQIASQPIGHFFGNISEFAQDLKRYRDLNETVIIALDDEAKINSLQNDLLQLQINPIISKEVLANRIQFIKIPLYQGFRITTKTMNLTVFTEKEIFEKVKKTNKQKNAVKINNAEKIRAYDELNVGDYVVHVNHGIGQYEGIKSIEHKGKKQDYLEISYQKSAKVFVPVNQIALVQKYMSSKDGVKPKINKLGGTEWKKTKAQVGEKIEDIADELLDIYAEREIQEGFAFPKDDALQEQFDNAFPYPETEDQLRSIAEIKKDMQKTRPMDRLLVGDVGFGKTEVALRAAFKAVEAHKQVAILVPTTILAEQHYNTILTRFSAFPETKVGVLSRFQSSVKNKELIKQLKNHEIDIVVGTHRLLSNDVNFADLGLLIIDEEQRFGVKHKEKLKQLRKNVDVLTLTATPIPRTLNMAMVGVRDLSVIETPPANRYPIQTYVMEYNIDIIKDVIEKEINRDGQVYYLHNRVNDIDQVAFHLNQYIPNARIAVVHGQMTEKQIEEVLYAFVNHEYDVLVTTTIIETGVDIANVNTLIVDEANKMGLSQLYQLRGRVGRSDRLAYAYFTYPFMTSLNADAEKRLEAIRDFTELGSGFKIAMRDLSIRGAGDLLGKKQHGFIDSVGYELYIQMLMDAVKKKQGKHVEEPKTNAELVLEVDAYIPDSLVKKTSHKLELYNRIKTINNDEDFQAIEQDFIDMFGEIDDELYRLLLISEIKNIADKKDIINIRQKNNLLDVVFAHLIDDNKKAKIQELIAQQALTVKLVNDNSFSFLINPKEEAAIWLIKLKDILQGLK